MISPSKDCTTFEKNASTFTFNCSGNGTFLLWTVDGYTTGTLYLHNKGIQPEHITVSSDRLTVSSQLIVPTTKANYNITIICIVQDSSFNSQSSNPVKLFLQGTALVQICTRVYQALFLFSPPPPPPSMGVGGDCGVLQPVYMYSLI